jgi:adenine phosphoribosyltransferase
MGEQESCRSGSGGGGGEMAVEQAPAAGKEESVDPRLQGISDAIRVVPHFPKQGPCVECRITAN